MSFNVFGELDHKHFWCNMQTKFSYRPTLHCNKKTLTQVSFCQSFHSYGKFIKLQFFSLQHYKIFDQIYLNKIVSINFLVFEYYFKYF